VFNSIFLVKHQAKTITERYRSSFDQYCYTMCHARFKGTCHEKIKANST